MVTMGFSQEELRKLFEQQRQIYREASASKPMGFILQPRPHLAQVQPLVYMLHLDTQFCRLSPRGRIRRVVTSEDWDWGKIDGDHGIFAGGAQKAV